MSRPGTYQVLLQEFISDLQNNPIKQILLSHFTDEDTEVQKGLSSLSKEIANKWLSQSLDPGLSDAKGTQSQLMAQQMAVGDCLHFAFINSVTSASKIGSVCFHTNKIQDSCNISQSCKAFRTVPGTEQVLRYQPVLVTVCYFQQWNTRILLLPLCPQPYALHCHSVSSNPPNLPSRSLELSR